MAAIPRAEEPSYSLSPPPVFSNVSSPSLLSFCSLPRACSCPMQMRRTSATETSSSGVGGDTFPYPDAPPLSLLGGGARQRKCGHSAWASLLEVRGPRPLPGSVPSDGAGDGSLTSRRLPPTGPERTGYWWSRHAISVSMGMVIDLEEMLITAMIYSRLTAAPRPGAFLPGSARGANEVVEGTFYCPLRGLVHSDYP
ncbi:uncharacterized protein LOC127428339 isoform X2 [Myxocyprinus asiaticus]|uniref:uncharacterized protein LOC127428339 isoform X2 n=1 Tax=Myxocyprinus asiaticus TaxID=70543 RepID=UPI002221519B|nr:uncharacterized protein LOC127428339 isoform X2 [Myxocyprinus asiaticus]